MAAVIDRMNEPERRWIDPKLDREIVPHGFRSSLRDWAKHGYDDPIAEAALAAAILPRFARFAKPATKPARPASGAVLVHLQPAFDAKTGISTPMMSRMCAATKSNGASATFHGRGASKYRALHRW